MTQYIIAYIATAAAFAVIDLLWIGIIARNFYFDRLGDILQINLWGALIFYLVYIAGIVYFAIAPALAAPEVATWKMVLLGGCVFGFFAYATYDLTNLATIKDWSYVVTVVDMVWGTILTGSSAVAGYLITKFFIG